MNTSKKATRCEPRRWRCSGGCSARNSCPPDFEKGLWARFWDYANDPELAREKGVRAAHGEAPSIQLRPGKSYRVELRASGGISVVPETAPPPGQTSGLH